VFEIDSIKNNFYIDSKDRIYLISPLNYRIRVDHLLPEYMRVIIYSKSRELREIVPSKLSKIDGYLKDWMDKQELLTLMNDFILRKELRIDKILGKRKDLETKLI